MLDEIIEHLCLRMAQKEWTGLDELSGILERRGLGEEEAKGVIGFLRSYFLEVDEIGKRARLSPWVCSFCRISGL